MNDDELAELLREDWIVDFLGVDAVAAHEAAHAVVARHLGWHVDQIVLRDAAGPRTEVWPRAGLAGDVEVRERLLIACAGRAADVARTGDVGAAWSAGDIGVALELAGTLADIDGTTTEWVIEDAERAATSILAEHREQHESLTCRLIAAGWLTGADVDDVLAAASGNKRQVPA